MTQYTALIVDDDTRLRQLLKKYLMQNDFVVTEAASAADAEDLLKYFKPDIIIMDVMMPHKNGDILTTELRQKGITIPIIILTAKGDPNSRIAGLEAGADDYLPKPFEPKELLLRLHNLLKRQTPTTDQLTFGPYTYHTQTGIVTCQGKQIPLTGAEQTLLEILLQHTNQEMTREQLASALNLENTRTIDVQITRLRKKIETEPNTHCIQTIRGKGYKLVTT